MKSIFNSHNILLKALLALALCFVSVHAWGNSYYAKLTVSVHEDDRGKGRVYASIRNSQPSDDSVYLDSSESDSQESSSSGSAKTFYAFAKAQGGYQFDCYTVIENAQQGSDDANQFTVNCSKSGGDTNIGVVSARFKVNPNKYTIKFTGDGVNIDDWTYDVENRSKLPAPQRNAYKFMSWKPQSEPTDETDFFSYGWKTYRTYSEDSTLFHKFGNVTLVAQWETISYDITYQDDKDGTGTLTPTSYNIESTAVLPTLTKDGYKFEGWKPSVSVGNWNSAEIYIAGTSLKEKYGDVTLVAQWTANEYTITFNTNGGTPSTYAPITYHITDASFDLPTPTRDGYTFAGWQTSTKVGNWEANTSYSGSQSDMWGTVELVAQWDPLEYTISFYPNGGEFEDGGKDDIKKSYNSDGTDPSGKGLINKLPKVVRTGYDFKGWKVTNTDEDSWWKDYTPSAEDNGMSVVGKWGNVELTAQWAPIKYKITLNPNGGKFPGGTTATTDYDYDIEGGTEDGKISKLPKVEMAGNAFKGWEVTSTGTSGWSDHTPGVDDNEMSVVGMWGDVTLKAQWEPIPGYIKISVTGLKKNDSAVFEVSYDSVKVVVSLDSSNASGLLVKIPDVVDGKGVTVTPKAWPKNYDKRETDAVTGEVKATHKKSDPLVFGFTMDERTSNIFETSCEF